MGAVAKTSGRKTTAIHCSRCIPHSCIFGWTLRGEKQALEEAVGPVWTKRMVPAELLPLEYIATRLPEMEPTYTQMMQIVHSLISRAFSGEVITPGKTTSQDVVWWLRQEVNRMGLDVWFQPSVRVQRKGATGVRILDEAKAVVIERGDVLHTDFGITALRLNTDTQHMGYVLKEGETDAPAGIRQALANSNRLQDLLMERLKPGKTGNEVLQETLTAMKSAGIKGTVYTHPIGDQGHGAGPLIGLWDRQESIPAAAMSRSGIKHGSLSSLPPKRKFRNGRIRNCG